MNFYNRKDSVFPNIVIIFKLFFQKNLFLKKRTNYKRRIQE
jgi:hypothetical protein